VVVAGYTEDMERFVGSNPGLASRFARNVEFPNYTAEQMVEILVRMANSSQYQLDEILKGLLLNHFEKRCARAGKDFGNAREVRNLFEHLVLAHSNRLATMDQPSTSELTTFTAEDWKDAV